MKMNRTGLVASVLLGGALSVPAEATIELYMDQKTKQIYAEPGPGRIKLGTFEQVDEKGTDKAAHALEEKLDRKKAELEELEKRIDKKSASIKAAEKKIEKVASIPSPSGEKKWFDKISLKGYLQTRYSQLLNGDEETRNNLAMPNDNSIGQNSDLLIRRMRLALTADVSDHLLLYLQPDFAANIPGTVQTNATNQYQFAQIRDAYADVFVDKAREYRFRIGQSKVPFGWENLQSSQNRIAFERNLATDANALRDERDLGIFAMWSPDVAQERFKYLQKSGLRGSGDYGVVAFGVYNGQGANRFELNDNMHFLGRVTYPFELPGDQILEIGASGYNGKYVVQTADFNGPADPITGNVTQFKLGQNFFTTANGGRVRGAGGKSIGPSVRGIQDGQGQQDMRAAIHAVLYPRPFGLQTEWTWGIAPTLQFYDLDDPKKALALIESKNVWGGYVQAHYKIDHWYGSWMPYARFETYNGGSKFDNNSPNISERLWEFGIEYQPWPEVEVTAAYDLINTTNFRTVTAGTTQAWNSKELMPGYQQADGSVLRLQVQANY
jgi:hypothetical protein